MPLGSARLSASCKHRELNTSEMMPVRLASFGRAAKDTCKPGKSHWMTAMHRRCRQPKMPSSLLVNLLVIALVLVNKTLKSSRAHSHRTWFFMHRFTGFVVNFLNMFGQVLRFGRCCQCLTTKLSQCSETTWSMDSKTHMKQNRRNTFLHVCKTR